MSEAPSLLVQLMCRRVQRVLKSFYRAWMGGRVLWTSSRNNIVLLDFDIVTFLAANCFFTLHQIQYRSRYVNQ